MAEILSADARQVSLGGILQLAEGEGFTGVVRLGEGVVTVYRGSPVTAALGAVSGLPALLELFLVNEGRFVLDLADVEAGVPMGSVGHLVLEGCRLLDEWRRLSELVLVVAPDRTANAALMPLVGMLDGWRPLRGAVARSGMGRAEIVDLVIAGLEAGDLMESTALPGGVSLDIPDDFDACVEAGRKFVRDTRYPEASAAFSRALSIRPGDRVAMQNLRRLAAILGD